MTNPDDKAGTDRTPQGNAPSWVDEVLNAPAAAPRPAAPPAAPAAPAPSWVDDVVTGPQAAPAAFPSQPAPPAAPAVSAAPTWPEDLRIPEPAPRAAPAAPTVTADGDWVSRATGAQAKDPVMPQGPYAAPASARSELDSLGDSARQAMQQVSSAISSSDVGQKKVIAGLLGIILGSLGVHKFYLGMTTPGLIMLGVNVGVWILALLLGLVTLGVGLIVTIPLASLVSGAIGLLGLVEGIIYLTKSDPDFERDYVIGKKAWL
ncbi:TM2 domain-containing protein [Deinococcus sp. KSM4-11]|uniref:TM2 domain-containing protein n=1 Tax=Deinococcus sp. KSM4-11 TaxID=2568654 RepID=UPI0010A32859|nr:NINE protein [Deinococcus sp. KSM4-11]THF84843.1 TM2 domain-containing protein [Deinococcus sp. KSM4-11]